MISQWQLIDILLNLKISVFYDQYYTDWFLPEESGASVILTTKIHSTESCSVNQPNLIIF